MKKRLKSDQELQRARGLWHLSRYEEALSAFRKAVKYDSQNTEALLDAARALGARFEIKEAQRLLAHLEKMTPRRPELMQQIAQSYRMIYRSDQAIGKFKKSLRKNKNLPDSLAELAVLSERRNQLEDAADYAKQCIAQQPGHPAARLIEAKVSARQGDRILALQGFENIANDSAVPREIRAEAYCEIAGIQDGDGDYTSAIESAGKSKNIMAPVMQPLARSAENERQRLKSLVEGFVTHCTNNFPVDDSGLDHTFKQCGILTGCPRSGTTLLERILDGHSKFISSDELPAFPHYLTGYLLRNAKDQDSGEKAMASIPSATLTQARRRYQKFIESALNEKIGERVFIDKNPSVTSLIPMYLKLVPHGKIIYALRDPRDIIVSCYLRYLPPNAISARFTSFENSARRTVEELKTWLTLKALLPDQFVEVRYEDTVADIQSAVQPVLDLWGLPWDGAMSDYRSDLSNKPVNSPSYAQLAKPVYTTSMSRWKNYEKSVVPLRALLEPVMKRLGYEW